MTETRNTLKFRYFFYMYIIAGFLELFFNREFLVGTLPLGAAGVTLSTTTVFQAMFYLGALAFALVLLLQPLVYAIGTYRADLPRWVKGLLYSVLYLTLMLDAVHLYFGVNNTGFNPPVLFSLVYVTLILFGMYYIALRSRQYPLLAALVPETLAYLVLVGAWLVELTSVEGFNYITLASGILMSYAVMGSGVILILYSITKGTPLRLLIPFAVVGGVVAIVVGLNLAPGLGYAIGVVFPYVFGILGIRDWMPPVFFFIALLTFGASLGLLTRGSRETSSVGYTYLGLMSAALVFDSVSSTVYLLAPLAAYIIGSSIEKVI